MEKTIIWHMGGIRTNGSVVFGSLHYLPWKL